MRKKKSLIIMLLPFIFPAFLSLPAFACLQDDPAIDIEAAVSSLKTGNSTQVLLVINNCEPSFTVKIYALEKHNGKWKKTGEPFNGVIGEKGFAGPDEKREGDGKSPSGIFSLLMTFGYTESSPTKMPYRQSLTDDLWIDDINAVDYNRWVKKEDTQAASYEIMRRNDDLYKYGIIIEYNTNPVIKGQGSAIFIHVWGGENISTAGCVAMPEDNLVRILHWLDPQALPLIIMGTEDIIKGFIQ